IYEANKDYFNGENKNFWDESLGDALHQSYWTEEGYPRYCAYLRGRVTISYADVDAVLQSFKIPFSVYSRSAGTLSFNNGIKNELIPLEIAIDERGEHYYLLKPENSKNPSILNEYQKQFSIFNGELQNVLAINTLNKIPAARTRNCLFLAAALPFDQTYL